MSDKNALMEEVRQATDAYLNEKESAAKSTRAEEMIEKASETIEALNELLEARNTEMADTQKQGDELSTKVSALEAQLRDLQEQLEKSKSLQEEYKQRAETAENNLAEMFRDQELDKRVKELEAAKVLKSGNQLEIQRQRVRSMSNEDFAAYKQELVDMRSELEAAVKAELAAAGSTEVVTPPPDVSAANKEVAQLNVEAEATEDLKEKFSRFGQAVADMLSAGRKADK